MKSKMTNIIQALGMITMVSSMVNADFNNHLLSLAQLLDLKQITIINRMDKEIKLMKHFSRHGIATSVKNYHEHDLIMLIDDINSGDIQNAVKTMKKGLLVFKNFQAIKEVMDILKCHINHQVYLYDLNSNKLHETYEINGMKIFNTLGHFDEMNRQFIWLSNVEKM